MNHYDLLRTACTPSMRCVCAVAAIASRTFHLCHDRRNHLVWSGINTHACMMMYTLSRFHSTWYAPRVRRVCAVRVGAVFASECFIEARRPSDYEYVDI